MATALDLITSSMRLIGAVASGETLPLSEANDGLSVLNDMIDSWNADRLHIYTTSSTDFPYVSGQQAYTLGTGGDFNMARPPAISGMSTIIKYNPANPVEVPISMFSVDEWQSQVPVKTVAGSIPLICYDTGDFPLRSLNFWPIPTDSVNSVRIYSWSALAAQTLATAVAFPPGYAQAFRYNLAVLLAAEFAQPLTPLVAQIAAESLTRIKIMNAPDLDIKSDLVPDPAGWNYKAELFGIGL